MLKMSELQVNLYMIVLGLCALGAILGLLMGIFTRKRMSKASSLLYWGFFIGGLLTATLYLLFTGTSANGFLD